MVSLADQYITKLIHSERIEKPGWIETERAIEILREFYKATVEECGEKILADRNFKVLRREK